MKPTTTEQSPVTPSSTPTARRPFLRALAAAGVFGAVGLPGLAAPARAIPDVTIEYKRCHVVFVSNASALDAIAVYYADRDGGRNARYDIDPTTTNPRGYEPLVVEYNADEDRTQIQLAEPRGGLACVIAEAGRDRTVATNPNDVCVPAEFNTAPTASFTVSDDPTVGEPVTFTSTASDPDSPERLYYAWDLDGDGTYEASGESVTTAFGTSGEKTVRHRVTDDCGASAVTTQTITVVVPSPLFEQVAKLTAADAQSSDFFGNSVSVDGDTALVGAIGEDPNGEQNVGSAYVFTRSEGVWTEQQKLFADDAQSRSNGTYQQFGCSVSVDGDTAFVGSYLQDLNASRRYEGAVYVFTRSGGVWTQQQKLTADVDQSVNNDFGYSVSVDGDTALVGAPGISVGFQPRVGTAYVFTRSGGIWTQQQKLFADDIRRQTSLGKSVSLDGDTAVVAGWTDGFSVGSLYVFTRSEGVWTQQQKLTPEDAAYFLNPLTEVSVDGDTVLIGTPNTRVDGISRAGSVYVFTRNEGVWTQQQKLTAAEPLTAGFFGLAVSVDGNTALIGAWSEEPDGSDAGGVVYVFTRSDGVWTQQQSFVATDTEAIDRFGFAVSFDGATALVGAQTEDPDGKTNAGSAYVFST